jgi:plasmid maintenance system antidote protein VapI
MIQRFKDVAEELKKMRKVYSDADLARILGISRGEMSNVIAGRRPVSKRIVDNLTTAFPEISKGWLVSGEGEMFKSSAVAESQSISIAGEEIKENEINVNTDATIAALIAEVSAQRRLTESALAEIAAQRKLTETALKQSADLIAKIG